MSDEQNGLDPDERLVSPGEQPDDVQVEPTLRPQRLEEFIGQRRIVENLRVYITAARRRGEALDHVLFCGPPGLGKTTLAYIIGNELGVDVHVTAGPSVEHKGVLAGLLTGLEVREVLFLDEIHRLNPAVEEYLYPAMEDWVLDVPSGAGAFSQTLRLPLLPFTLIGATTRSGLLTSPLRDRFGIVERLDHYGPEDMVRIVRRSAGIMKLEIEEDAAQEIGRRSRGTPRVANRLLRRVRDFAEVYGDGRVNMAISKRGLSALAIDELGLDAMDRNLMRTIIEKYGGGPVGVEALSAALHEERDTLENEVEPFLIQSALIQRTPRGRVAMPAAYLHLGLPMPDPETGGGQGTLF